MNGMNGIAVFDPNCTWNRKGGGGVSGTIKLHQCSPSDFTVFTLDLRVDEPNSTHALHIHESGNLSQGCMGAGAHYNPFNKTHGTYKIHKKKRHVGDLVNNVTSDSEGRIKLIFKDDLVTLYGPRSVFGRTLVIHTGEDDLGLGGNKESLITGNAKGRMACALIGHDN